MTRIRKQMLFSYSAGYLLKNVVVISDEHNLMLISVNHMLFFSIIHAIYMYMHDDSVIYLTY